MKSQNKKVYAIFYKVGDELYSIITSLGCIGLSSNKVNLYTDKKQLDNHFNRSIKVAHRKVDDKINFDTTLKPEYRHGKVFIACVGRKNFPVKVDMNSAFFQREGYALRVSYKKK